MDLNKELNKYGKNRKFIFCFCVFVFIVIVLCCFLYLNSSVDEPSVDVVTPPIVGTEPVIDEDELVDTPQNNTISVLKAYVESVRDLSVRFEYDVSIGTGDTAVKSVVKATGNTVFVDLINKKLLSASSITVGSNVVLYATGNYNVGDLSASVIGVGEDTKYRYGELSESVTSVDDSLNWKLNNTSDKLSIPTDCLIIDGYTGEPIVNIGIIELGSKLLYSYDSDYQITEQGNIYTCNEILVIGDVE